MNSPASTVRGPVRADERALAPDLARGFMLLLIAVANTPWYLWGRAAERSSVHPPGGSLLDQLTQGVIITAVDLRVYPMFAFLFGYGIMQLYRRQLASGAAEPAARALLQRRNLWLLAFGFVHAALLWMGDVLGAYGLAGLLLVWLFVRRRDRTLLVAAAVGAGVLVLLALLAAAGAGFAAAAEPQETADMMGPGFMVEAAHAQAGYLQAAVWRVGIWGFIVFFQGLLTLAVPVAVLLGFWAARHRILEEPGRHLPLLRRTAAAGIAAAWLGGGAHALAYLGIWAVPEAAMFVWEPVQLATGLAGGLGYVALFGLLGRWLSSRGGVGVIGTAVTAVGKRSLSSYLAQSVLCAPILAAWGLGLGAQLHSASMAAFAVGVWLVTAAAAYALERAGRRGPAEVLLRRLAYRRPIAADRAATAAP